MGCMWSRKCGAIQVFLPWLGFELLTSWLKIQHASHYTIKQPIMMNRILRNKMNEEVKEIPGKTCSKCLSRQNSFIYRCCLFVILYIIFCACLCLCYSL